MRMKKRYVPPMIAIEHYELTQAIANCESIKIGFASSSCVMKDSDADGNLKTLAGSGYFLAGSCQFESIDQDPNDGNCYHTSVGAFTS